jgi:hypothetical protein
VDAPRSSRGTACPRARPPPARRRVRGPAPGLAPGRRGRGADGPPPPRHRPRGRMPDTTPAARPPSTRRATATARRGGPGGRDRNVPRSWPERESTPERSGPVGRRGPAPSAQGSALSRAVLGTFRRVAPGRASRGNVPLRRPAPTFRSGFRPDVPLRGSAPTFRSVARPGVPLRRPPRRSAPGVRLRAPQASAPPSAEAREGAQVAGS